MPSISSATSAAQAIFSLDVITAVLAFLLFVAATAIVITRLKNGQLVYPPFLLPALFCLTVSYAVQSAVVALQLDANTPASITAAFSYIYSGVDTDTSSTRTISILTFTQQLAAILFTLFLTGAVWLHSNNLTSNGTGASSPGTISRIWNAFILTLILAFGLATWGQGLAVRGSSQSYPDTIISDRITRTLYIVFRCVVIFASTSVTIQVLVDYKNLKANGLPNNSERPLLARFAFIVVPLIWLRNAFIIVNIVLIYQTVSNWSTTANQAVAFLLIIFGQLANSAVLFVVLWGAWSMGRSAGMHGGKASGPQHSDA